jgi:DNA-binding NarL/FixJ family response regulator
MTRALHAVTAAEAAFFGTTRASVGQTPTQGCPQSVGVRLTTVADLTEDQVAILRALASGKRLNELARERGVTRQALNARADRIRDAIGVRTIFQMGAWAERHGIREQGGG